ncbi:hypothetical protein JV173_01135 [Acholeplasma equirhinis]|uniref:glycoside hydrolase family 66 protein n=1 Tax=Acholeplasma equirhinis TaxID=555393 RepID=UPI00197ACD5D|nr:glycoside hydrolase family 66 protein [Acholeplasma equirhinis]MBN3490108.1 hypothetical protein [Acholeplasma equirhinis]
MTLKATFDKAQYLNKESVLCTVYGLKDLDNKISVELYNLHQKVDVNYFHKYVIKDEIIELVFELSMVKVGNYGLHIHINDEVLILAFDVVNHYKEAFRYGFLSDFKPNDGDQNDLDYIKDLKLNAVQFYDWMYRHDDLIAPSEHYLDPLGRETSLTVIKDKVNYARKLGVRPFAYGAVYAGTKELFLKHQDWALYTREKEPMIFADWLYFMNVTHQSPWSNHIVKEFYKSMNELGFMGIHMDTYGFPKVGEDYEGNEVRLYEELPKLIDQAADEAAKISQEHGVIFNAVNNWPIDSVAQTKQDASYIEVWPPHNSYLDLYQLIRRARQIGHKNVVLAAYMHPFKDAVKLHEVEAAERSLLLTQAVIMASGGTQLVYGEDESILCDSYYANYRKLRKEFLPAVYRYTDFIVRYASLLYNDSGYDISMTATDGINNDYQFSHPEVKFSANGKENTIWTILRERQKRVTIHLINLVNQNDRWNEPKNELVDIKNIDLKIFINRKIKGIYTASPDDNLQAQSIPFEVVHKDKQNGYHLLIDNLKVLRSVWIEME